MKLNGCDSPLLLVLDLDETLVHVDEENELETTHISIFYRTDIFAALALLRKWFERKLFLVLWSTADDTYVNEIIYSLSMRKYFDLILGRSAAKKSKRDHKVSKSLSFLLSHCQVREWLKEMFDDPDLGYPVYAIVDDRAEENTDIDDPFDYTFSLKPMDLNAMFVDKSGKLRAAVPKLARIFYFLILQCLVDEQGTFLASSDNGCRFATTNLNPGDTGYIFEVAGSSPRTNCSVEHDIYLDDDDDEDMLFFRAT